MEKITEWSRLVICHITTKSEMVKRKKWFSRVRKNYTWWWLPNQIKKVGINEEGMVQMELAVWGQSDYGQFGFVDRKKMEHLTSIHRQLKAGTKWKGMGPTHWSLKSFSLKSSGCSHVRWGKVKEERFWGQRGVLGVLHTYRCEKRRERTHPFLWSGNSLFASW